ncbi:MAG: oligosaccharide flippase family protein, partial [Janthinobacterium lividum]
MAVGFFLAPFIVHRLGNEAYGIWVLAISSISYLAMLDLGMRSSVLRFISKGRTVGDHESSSAALSGALWVRLQISLVVLILAAILAYVFPLVFKVPHSLARDAQCAVMIIGVNTAITMSMGVFGGVLSGINRYDMQTVVVLVQIAIRVTGVVMVLRHGRGIVAIAGCEFLATLVGNVLLVILARRLYPELRVSFRRPESQVLRALWSYSVYAFLSTVAMQLVYQTDNLVVGGFISAAAVTLYSIGNSLSR